MGTACGPILDRATNKSAVDKSILLLPMTHTGRLIARTTDALTITHSPVRPTPFDTAMRECANSRPDPFLTQSCPKLGRPPGCYQARYAGLPK